VIIARMARKKRMLGPEQIEIIGEARPLLRDAYHGFIRASWSASLGIVASSYLAMNVLFALAYHVAGGVTGAHDFLDCFFFSVQTSGTIGYGTLHPSSTAAEAVVTVEALSTIIFVAITTGLVFAKFSRPQARVQFAKNPAIAIFDGVPTLMFRLGNQRDSRLIEATLRVVLTRTEINPEGVKLYRLYDLTLERDRSPALSRSWLVLHRIRPGGLLDGATPESLARDEVEFTLTLVGLDEVSAQSLHAQMHYTDRDVRFDVRHADMLSERPDGGLRLDITRFDELVPMEKPRAA
jgi:inward rectifier potassium channel